MAADLNSLILQARAISAPHAGLDTFTANIIDQLVDEIERRHGIGGELVIARRQRDVFEIALNEIATIYSNSAAEPRRIAQVALGRDPGWQVGDP